MAKWAAPSTFSHAPGRASLHRGHLQCAKQAGHCGKENTQKPAFGASAATCSSHGLSAEKQRAGCLLNGSLPWLLLSSFMFRKQKMQVNSELMGLFYSLFPQDSALSKEFLGVQ